MSWPRTGTLVTAPRLDELYGAYKRCGGTPRTDSLAARQARRPGRSIVAGLDL
jgi:hypothetical protein